MLLLKSYVRPAGLICLGLLGCLALTSCGGGGGGATGGGGGGGGTTGTVSASVAWPARTRAISAPTSAQSVVFTLHPTSGSDINQEADRTQAAAYTGNYTISSVPVGTYTATATFFANIGGSGAVVATGSVGNVVVNQGSTTGMGAISMTDTITSVVVNPVPAGITADQATALTFTAKNSGGTTVAVSPGSGQWTKTAGTGSLSPDGVAFPTASGTYQVKVVVDGITSPIASITVNPASGNTTPTVYFSYANGAGTTIGSVSPSGGSPTTITSLTTNYQGFAYTLSGSAVSYGYTVSPNAATPVYGVWEGASFNAQSTRRLTNDTFTGLGTMQFGNDGQTVFFSGQIFNSGTGVTTSNVYSVLPGSAAKTLDSAEDMAVDPTGSKIVYTKLASVAEIWAMNVDGTGKTQVTNDGVIDKAMPQWSGDGSQIVFIGTGSSGATDVYTIPAAGGTPTNVTNGGQGICIGASFNPAGGQIAFISLSLANSSLSGVFRINTDGTGVATLYNNAGINGGVYWIDGGVGPLLSRSLSAGGGAVGGRSLGLARILGKRR